MLTHRLAAALLFAAMAPAAGAQLSLAGAVGVALRGNPRVRGASADVAKANAQVAEALDAYIPSITAGAGLGQAYGYSPQPPTLGTVSAGSIIFNSAQPRYIRSARQGLLAAQLALQDVREAVAEDTALAFLSLAHDQQRQAAIAQQIGYAGNLVAIVQKRLDAGEDSKIDLTQARLTAAQLRLASLKAEDDIAYDREHLGRLIGVPPASLQIDDAFPSTPVPATEAGTAPVSGYANAAVASAFATAAARQQQALGDARFHWPQINLVAQYNRYATFTDSFAALQKLNTLSNGQTTLKADEGAFGVQIVFPILDKGHAAKARQSAAEATRALSDAQNAQLDALDGQARLRHSIAELEAQAEVASLQQQYAQEQLDIVNLEIQSGTGNPDAPQMSPKDAEKARIAERDKYLAVIDAGFQLRQAEIQLLRQTGNLETWLNSAPAAPANPPASTPTPQTSKSSD